MATQLEYQSSVVLTPALRWAGVHLLVWGVAAVGLGIVVVLILVGLVIGLMKERQDSTF